MSRQLRATLFALLPSLLPVQAQAEPTWNASLPIAGPAQETEQTQEKIERFKAWPEVASKDKKRLKRELAKLRKARTEKMGEDATLSLIEFGPSAAPDILKALAKEKDKQAQKRLLKVANAITDARATRLLSAEFDSKSLLLRRWALETVTEFPDAGAREAAEAALQRVAAQKEKDRDTREYDAAAMCALSTGSLAGIERAKDIALDRWKDNALTLRSSLEQVRGDEATALALADFASGDRKVKLVALRLLAGCGSKSAVSRIGSLLNSSDNALRVETINALRGVVDGAPALLKLSAFEAVERATKWKGRL